MKKKKFYQEIYQKASVSDLILFCVSSIGEKKEKCTFERLVSECFNLFPKTFKLSSSLNWPDSRKLDRPLRTLRKRELVKLSPESSYALTKSGRKKVEGINKLFGQTSLEI
ncbi:MAG: hypothetical protein PHI53_02330 [Candidatus Pacebacteria bacterium]|nr:hypothetical protein [Candidatus Paceibacterota bacterium]